MSRTLSNHASMAGGGIKKSPKVQKLGADYRRSGRFCKKTLSVWLKWKKTMILKLALDARKRAIGRAVRS